MNIGVKMGLATKSDIFLYIFMMIFTLFNFNETERTLFSTNFTIVLFSFICHFLIWKKILARPFLFSHIVLRF